MSVLTIASGQDAHVNSGNASRSYPDARYPRVEGSVKRILLSMPLAATIRDRTILAATLSIRVRGTWAAQTVTVARLAASWKADRATWDEQPATTGTTAQVTTGALTDGARFEVDITTLVQAVADGADHYGWRITTTAGTEQAVYGFDSGADTWVLTVEYSDVLSQPTQLSPVGAVSLLKPVLTTEPFDDLAAFQVEIRNPDTLTVVFDSGEVVTTVAKLDLATTSFVGVSADQTRQWRARAKANGVWSAYSDWVAITRRLKPALSVTAPAGTVVRDSTPTVGASIASGVIQRWQIRVTALGNRSSVVYDSGQMAGNGTAALSWTIPAGFLKEDKDYELHVRVWDRTDRAASAGDPAWIEVWRNLTVDTDSSQTAPATLTVTQDEIGQPGVTLRWTRSPDPTEFKIMRDGKEIDRVSAVDAKVSTGTFEWVDRTAPPNTPVTYTVRAVTSGNQSGDSPAAQITQLVRGEWLLSDDHGDVVLDEGDFSGIVRRDKRATYDLPGRRDTVEVVTAFGGYEGPYKGEINNFRKDYDLDDAAAALHAMKYDPAVPVRWVFGHLNIPVRLSHVSVPPHSEQIPPRMLRRVVTFTVQQSGEFDDDGMP